MYPSWNIFLWAGAGFRIYLFRSSHLWNDFQQLPDTRWAKHPFNVTPPFLCRLTSLYLLLQVLAVYLTNHTTECFLPLGQASYFYPFICTSPTWNRRANDLLSRWLVSKIHAQISQDKWNWNELQPPNPSLTHSGSERARASLNPAFHLVTAVAVPKENSAPWTKTLLTIG